MSFPLIMISFIWTSCVWAGAIPYLHFKTGISSINVTAGDRLVNVPLKPAITLKPTVLWDLPSFSSRMGVHFLQELKSMYGFTPLSGIGVTGYYYFYGITTNHLFTDDDILHQKSRPGPYMSGSFTPANLNINKFDESTPLTNFYFSSQVNEVALGLGYDYPYKQNMIFSGEFTYRSGTNANTSKEQVNYSGFTLFLGFGTSYY
ncbi:MAG: hypothetical protein JNL11_07680 [Bdellovibrionaceae bacterium]|nr:hypothetical protein [Pseudobdellovibrionaceae bacterium]